VYRHCVSSASSFVSSFGQQCADLKNIGKENAIKSKIRIIPDYPKKGIMFRDITTLIKDPVGFRLVIDNFT
jgi:hypothetical protein